MKSFELKITLDDIYNKSNDELWVETWLQQNNIYRPLPNLKKINIPINAMGIHEARSELIKCVSLMEKLNKVITNKHTVLIQV